MTYSMRYTTCMIIKVISLNMWHGGALFDGILQFLAEENADIVLLQEVFNGEDRTLPAQRRSMQVLREKLGYPYDDFAAAFRDFDHTNGKAERGDAILSKFPVIKRNNVFISESAYSETYRDIPGNYHNCPRELEHITLQTEAGEIDVFNLQGIWDLDGDHDSPARQKMSNVILREIAGKQNVLLGGDTNAKPTNPAIMRIAEKLNNVFAGALTSTFNMRRKTNPGYATAVVDMLLTSPNMRVLNKSCPDIDISDHLPLIATLELTKD